MTKSSPVLLDGTRLVRSAMTSKTPRPLERVRATSRAQARDTITRATRLPTRPPARRESAWFSLTLPRPSRSRSGLIRSSPLA
jgi:hypothetical protein